MPGSCEHSNAKVLKGIWLCPDCGAMMQNYGRFMALLVGPSDRFDVHTNNAPDEPEEEDDVYEPEDYTGDYPLEGDDEPE
jgi:hypothetical protein